MEDIITFLIFTPLVLLLWGALILVFYTAYKDFIDR